MAWVLAEGIVYALLFLAAYSQSCTDNDVAEGQMERADEVAEVEERARRIAAMVDAGRRVDEQSS